MGLKKIYISCLTLPTKNDMHIQFIRFREQKS